MKFRVTFHPRQVAEGAYYLEHKIKQDFARLGQRPVDYPANDIPHGTARRIGFDTEYDAKGNLLTVALATKDKAQAFEIQEKAWKIKFKSALRTTEMLCGHSVGGDLDYLVKLGCAKEKWLQGTDIKDSLLLARMYNENGARGTYGLENLMLDVYNVVPWKAATEKLLKSTGNAADWTLEQRKERCRLDAWAAIMLAGHFEKGLLNVPG